MVWYQELYASKNIARKKKKIKKRISQGKSQHDIYVLTLASNPKNLVDIIPSKNFLNKWYPKEDLFILGVAKGYEEARDLAFEIILEIYGKTGAFQVRDYFCNTNKAKLGGSS